ncbi:MAG: hypothetical protein R3D28_16750 [Geminicoccaceae bacterium]
MSTPKLAQELNDLWAAEGRSYRLGRHGVAHLWAIWHDRPDSGQPLLFIVGSEERAVAQAHAWANPDAGAGKADQPASAAA